ncbi:hypothetical protein HanRHA438_Chr08g0340781 [Helianthus annuus]|nr:hypothetical protein HanRHA438_Chr08g0340781 [Helianthus annuus]
MSNQGGWTKKTGGPDAWIGQIDCMQISAGRVLHQKAVTRQWRHRWFSSITEQR